MASSRLSSLCKELGIQLFSLGVSYATDRLIAYFDPKQEYSVYRAAFASRVYYFSKNMLNYIDFKINGMNADRHVYGAVFNGAVIVGLFPATKYFALTGPAENPCVAPVISLYSGLIARGVVETKKEKQPLKKHLQTYAASIVTGTCGIFISYLPRTGIVAPSCYWAGNLIDLYRATNGKFGKDVLFNPKSTPQVQALCAVLTRVTLSFSELSYPIQDYALDFIYGVIHKLAAYGYMHCNETAEQKPVETKVIQVEAKAENKTYVANNSVTLFVAPAPVADKKDEAQLEVAVPQNDQEVVGPSLAVAAP